MAQIALCCHPAQRSDNDEAHGISAVHDRQTTGSGSAFAEIRHEQYYAFANDRFDGVTEIALHDLQLTRIVFGKLFARNLQCVASWSGLRYKPSRGLRTP